MYLILCLFLHFLGDSLPALADYSNKISDQILVVLFRFSDNRFGFRALDGLMDASASASFEIRSQMWILLHLILSPQIVLYVFSRPVCSRPRFQTFGRIST